MHLNCNIIIIDNRKATTRSFHVFRPFAMTRTPSQSHRLSFTLCTISSRFLMFSSVKYNSHDFHFSSHSMYRWVNDEVKSFSRCGGWNGANIEHFSLTIISMRILVFSRLRVWIVFQNVEIFQWFKVKGEKLKIIKKVWILLVQKWNKNRQHKIQKYYVQLQDYELYKKHKIIKHIIDMFSFFKIFLRV